MSQRPVERTAASIAEGVAPRQATAAARHRWPWLAALVVAGLLPWLFFDWAHGRHSGFIVTMLTQMAIMSIFALSYNMLMGQAGLLSFGHAVFLGLGGYVTAHAVNASRGAGWWVPLEVMPLIGGVGGLVFALAFGYISTKQRATAFAMITLGIGELVTSAAIMFGTFFGGEGGVSTNRMIGASLFGLSYSASIQVYYLALGWTAVAIASMRLLTMTPIGRMANACRDNFERAQFVGYDPRMVRFFQFSLSGLFAGIAGGLYALTYEIVTYDAVAGAMSANALLMTYIGGIGVFAGPVVGAVIIVLLQSWVSLLSNSWLVYVGLLFIVMVTFAPGGIAGLALLHQPIRRAGGLKRLAVPYARVAVPALLAVVGFVLLIELCSFLTVGAAQGKAFRLGPLTIDPRTVAPWALGAGLLVGGGLWLWREGRRFAAAWQVVAETVKRAGMGR